MQCSEPFIVAPDGLLDLGSYRREKDREVPHTIPRAGQLGEEKKLVSPFTFTEISRNQRREKINFREKSGGKERHTKRKICVFCHTAFFFLLPEGRIEYKVSQELPAEINQSW